MKIALLVIASNEAAYIAEFVYHHLRHGFAPISIYVNNTDDRTVEILAAISKANSDIQFLLEDPANPIPKSKDFQPTAYRRLVDALGVSADYFAALDVDEFWCPAGLTASVQSYLADVGQPDVACANWVMPVNDERPFASLADQDVVGHINSHIKSIWRADLPVRRFHPHHPVLDGAVTTHVASGHRLGSSNSKTVAMPTSVGPAFVYHRMHRSLIEYLALLSRGRPRSTEVFKTNRAGYRYYINKKFASQLDAPKDARARWAAGYREFFKYCKIDDLIRAARLDTIDRAVAAVETYRALDDDTKLYYEQPFRLVNFEKALAQAEAARAEIMANA
ncbi:glycosyltransferase family 2 protein [Acuticoccus sediminis]|uniref:glycosyltransferase family 2 protein n=1 Tax=Acuticoccus sediminis TaxID=2184697 RepID=UPI001390C7BD|nr:glycosyltransferase family 2 protein [Acuticoccus sediminis]